MKLNRAIMAGILIIPVLFFTGSAHATPVIGYSNIFGNVSVSGTSIVFAASFATSQASETGDFAGLTDGTIMSLAGGPENGSYLCTRLRLFHHRLGRSHYL